MPTSCLFCRIAAGDLPATLVAEDERTVAFMDISPAAPGHTLVVPRAHADGLHDVDPRDLAAVVLTGQRVAAAARDGLGAEGVNLLSSTGAVAWQTVGHFHLHVIPRYSGDGLRMPWEPAPGDPAAITRAAERLRAAG